jgi:hypothetical protein
MDDVDRTAERQEREAPFLLRAAMKPAGPQPTGFCHWCEAPVTHLFCDEHCRDDWQFAQDRKKINGG